MSLSNKVLRWVSGSAVIMLLAALMTALTGSTTDAAANYDDKYTFEMIPSSAAIKTCLPRASAKVSIKQVKNGQTMTLSVNGLAPDADYDFFVLQKPDAKFGLAWYQSDLHTNSKGNGMATMRGIFSEETFTISLDTITTKGREGNDQTGAKFGAVNMYHLGLWFNDPSVPFKLGCEPGATQPIVTPFNGEQKAGIQVLNTSNFELNAGPLKNVKP